MALEAKIGSFTRPGGTIDQSITGLGFAPKAVLFFGNSMTADGGVSTGGNGPEYPMYLGFMDSADGKCYANTDDYSAGGPQIITTAVIYSYANANGGENAKASFVSLDADGFTTHWFNIDTAVVVNYLALGGSDLTNAKVLDCGAVSTVTGNVAYTGAGFQPDAIILIAGQTNGSPDYGGMGMAVSPTQRGTNATVYNGGPGTQRYERTDQCLSVLQSGLRIEADFVSMDSDGFTLNYSIASSIGPPQPPLYALCLKGGSYHVGAITEATSNTTKAETGVGFQPKGVFFSTVGKTAGTTVVGTMSQVYGAAVSTGEQAATGLIDGSSQIATRLDRTKCIVHPTDVGVPPAASSGGEANLVSMDSDGFTLNWASTDGTARETIYMAFGDEPATPAVASGPVLQTPLRRRRMTSW
jgi:hypothetical protein